MTTTTPWTIDDSIALHRAAERAKAQLDADRRLIAAAPDLLAALREMLCQFADHEQYDEDGYDTTAINKARAAIAKATGETNG